MLDTPQKCVLLPFVCKFERCELFTSLELSVCDWTCLTCYWPCTSAVPYMFGLQNYDRVNLALKTGPVEQINNLHLFDLCLDVFIIHFNALKVIASNKRTNVDSFIWTNDTVCFIIQGEKNQIFSQNATRETSGCWQTFRLYAVKSGTILQ